MNTLCTRFIMFCTQLYEKYSIHIHVTNILFGRYCIMKPTFTEKLYVLFLWLVNPAFIWAVVKKNTMKRFHIISLQDVTIFSTNYFILSKAYTDEGGVNPTVRSSVREIIHELKLVDILVQTDEPWYNYYLLKE